MRYRVLELKGMEPEQIREIERSVICKLGPIYNKQHSKTVSANLDLKAGHKFLDALDRF
jgi:hypothetical protein